MTKALKARGHEAQLFAGEVPPDEQSAEYLAEVHGVTVQRIGSLSRNISWRRDLGSLAALVKLFRGRPRPDVVHTHTAKAGALGRIAAIFSGVPIRVHTFHGHVFENYFSPIVTFAFINIERLLGRFTDRIIAISETQKYDLVHKYRIAPSDKIVCIPLGFEVEPYVTSTRKGEFRAALGVRDDQFLVGWIGRLTEIKDPVAFVEVARLVSQKHPQTRFVMLGDGKLRSQVEAAIRANGLVDRVFLQGVCCDLLPVYSDIDLLAVTSRNEGTPLAMLEAMASARPVVASDVGGVKDLMFGSPVECEAGLRFENGILAKPDAGKIAAGVCFYATQLSVAAAAGAAGREWVRTRYSYHRLADDLENLYYQIAAQKRSDKVWAGRVLPKNANAESRRRAG